MCRPARRPRSAAWPATTPAARARIAYGNMVHNVAGIQAWLADGRLLSFGPVSGLGSQERAIADFVRDAGRRAARRDRGALAQGDAPRRRLQPRHLPAAERAALHRRRQRQPGAPAGRRRGHAGVHAQLDVEAEPAAARQGAGGGELPELSRRDGRGAAHRQAGPERGRAGRPHDDRAVARQPGVPRDDRRGADRRAGGDPAGGVQRRRQDGRCCASCARWSI